MGMLWRRFNFNARAVGAGLVGGYKPPPLATYRTVSGRAGLPQDVTSGTNGTQSWVDHYPLFSGGQSMRLMFANRRLNGNTAEITPANPMFLKADVRLNGVRYGLTFGGATSLTLTPGQKVTSDPLNVSWSAGGTLLVVTYAGNPDGTDAETRKTVVQGIGQQSGYNEGYTANADITGALTAPGGTSGHHAPCIAVLGQPSVAAPSVIIFGSSSGFGMGDSQAAPYYALGYASRALSAAGIPHVRASVSGDKLINFNNLNTYRLEALADSGCTHVQLQLGSNDLTSNATLQQMKDRYMAACDKIAAIMPRIISVTATAVTTSTDSWATLENQKPVASDSIRQAYNAWLKTKPHSAINMVLDPCARLMDASNPSLWKVTGAANGYTVDGTHCSPYAHDLEGQAEALELAALTVA